MFMIKDEIKAEIEASWSTYLNALEKAIDRIGADIDQSSRIAGLCTNEWCEATEYYLDDIAKALYAISEPRWSSPQDAQRIKKLKHKVHDMYADSRQVFRSICA